jgi:cytochrome c peroxidase
VARVVSILPAARVVATALALLLVAARARAGAEFEWDLPLGFSPPKVPTSNPMSYEKVELGRRLFYDKRLSGNQTQACATCHEQARAFTDGLVVGIGSTGQDHPRNSMSLTNAGYGATLAWANPLLARLEDQIPVPMFGEEPVELGLAGLEQELLQRLEADQRYRDMFHAAFPGEAEPITVANVVRGLASFMRVLISGNSPYDRYVFGLDDNAISPSAVRGAGLFFSEKFECFHCHGGFNFSVSVRFEGQTFDETSFQNNALFNIGGNGDYPPNNTGIFEITGRRADMGFFKAPTLRNIELTAPYMHDGSIATLEEVLDHYAAGGRTITEGPFAGVGSDNPLKSMFMVGFTLSEQEREDMLNFLKSLTDTEFVTNPAFSDPFVNEETPSPSPPPTVTPTPGAHCAGDCDGSGSVSINELILCVNIALAQADVGMCPPCDINHTLQVTVDELVSSVNAAAIGCI